jgi:predicted metalloendopeptidase
MDWRFRSTLQCRWKFNWLVDSRWFNKLQLLELHLLIIQCALEPLPGVHVEIYSWWKNIGDLGGVNAAYDGLQLYLKITKPGLIDGLPWATFLHFLDNRLENKITWWSDQNQVKQIHTSRNVQSLCANSKCRCFYHAFDIKKGDGMYWTGKELKICRVVQMLQELLGFYVTTL